MDYLVAVVLDHLQLSPSVFKLVELLDHLLQLPRPVEDVVRFFLQKLKELLVLRNEPFSETHLDAYDPDLAI